MSYVQLAIEDLLFDLENPRYEKIEGQRDALEKIVNNQGAKIVSLANDIVAEGLSPADRPLVIRSENNEGKYIILEGNRRLASLKLLSNTALIESLDIRPYIKKKLKNLTTQFDPTEVEPIECALCESREEANHWIELRHTGENNGAGTVPWDGIASARFRGREVSLQAIDFVRKHGNLDKSNLKKLESIYITNLDRLLGDPDVREILGIHIEKGKLFSSVMPAEVIKGLKKLVLDIANKNINVSKIKHKGQRLEYIKKLKESEKPDLKKSTEPWPIDAVPTAIAASSKGLLRRSLRQSTYRRTLIPRKCILRIPDPRINAIYGELKDIKVESLLNATAVLMRVFLELTIDYYIDANSIIIKKGKDDIADGGRVKLSRRLDEVMNHLTTIGGVKKDDLKPLKRAISRKSDPFNIETLNNYVHNRFEQPIGKNLLISWDNAQVFFEKIWK